MVNQQPATKKKTNIFNTFFSKASNNDEEDNDDWQSPDMEQSEEEEESRDINNSTDEVKRVLQSLDTSKAKGLDTMSPKVMNETDEKLAPILAKIYNFSLKTSSFVKLYGKEPTSHP